MEYTPRRVITYFLSSLRRFFIVGLLYWNGGKIELCLVHNVSVNTWPMHLLSEYRLLYMFTSYSIGTVYQMTRILQNQPKAMNQKPLFHRTLTNSTRTINQTPLIGGIAERGAFRRSARRACTAPGLARCDGSLFWVVLPRPWMILERAWVGFLFFVICFLFVDE